MTEEGCCFHCKKHEACPICLLLNKEDFGLTNKQADMLWDIFSCDPECDTCCELSDPFPCHDK